jgi:hypothetical protein
MLRSKKTKQFSEFLKFTDWYLKMGGRTLNQKDIEKTYPKFEFYDNTRKKSHNLKGLL